MCMKRSRTFKARPRTNMCSSFQDRKRNASRANAREFISSILHNSFQATLVPSARLGAVLTDWGVENIRAVNLGVNTTVFSALPDDTAATRAELELPASRRLLLYVGRLAKEKNTGLLFRAFA